MQADPKAQIEEYKLAEIKRRINNWTRCFQDPPKEIKSSTLIVMEAIRFARFDPNNNPYSHIFKPSSSCYVDPADLKDAILLESVWRQIGADGEGDTIIGDTNITIGTAKAVIEVFAFIEGRRKWERYSELNIVRRKETVVERVSLLFFWERVYAAEKASKGNP